MLIIIFTDHSEFDLVPTCVDRFKDCCESDWTHKILVQVSNSQNAEGIVRNSAVKRLITVASIQSYFQISLSEDINVDSLLTYVKQAI